MEEYEIDVQSTIDKYIIESYLAEGQFGKVFRAIDSDSEQLVAIKIVKNSLLQKHPKYQELFNAEIDIMKQIKNKNVVQFIDHLQDHHYNFIIMEYCNEGDMATLLKKKKFFPESELPEYYLQILNAVKGLHELNIIHRDLKSPNILIHDSQLKLADYGFAKQLEQKGGLTNSVLGSACCMAPEIIEGKPYGTQADVYSLGCIFYQWAFGRYPYIAMSANNILTKIKEGQLKFQHENKISQNLQNLITSMLQYDINDRIKIEDIYTHPFFEQIQQKSAVLGLQTIESLKKQPIFDLDDNIRFYQQKQKKEFISQNHMMSVIAEETFQKSQRNNRQDNVCVEQFIQQQSHFNSLESLQEQSFQKLNVCEQQEISRSLIKQNQNKENQDSNIFNDSAYISWNKQRQEQEDKKDQNKESISYRVSSIQSQAKNKNDLKQVSESSIIKLQKQYSKEFETSSVEILSIQRSQSEQQPNTNEQNSKVQLSQPPQNKIKPSGYLPQKNNVQQNQSQILEHPIQEQYQDKSKIQNPSFILKQQAQKDDEDENKQIRQLRVNDQLLKLKKQDILKTLKKRQEFTEKLENFIKQLLKHRNGLNIYLKCIEKSTYYQISQNYNPIKIQTLLYKKVLVDLMVISQQIVSFDESHTETYQKDVYKNHVSYNQFVKLLREEYQNFQYIYGDMKGEILKSEHSIFYTQQFNIQAHDQLLVALINSQMELLEQGYYLALKQSLKDYFYKIYNSWEHTTDEQGQQWENDDEQYQFLIEMGQTELNELFTNRKLEIDQY